MFLLFQERTTALPLLVGVLLLPRAAGECETHLGTDNMHELHAMCIVINAAVVNPSPSIARFFLPYFTALTAAADLPLRPQPYICLEGRHLHQTDPTVY